MQQYFLINGLITNQIALLLPVRGRTEFGKMFGIDYRRFLFSPPPPSFPIILLTPGVLLRSPAFRPLVRSPPGKGKESTATQLRISFAIYIRATSSKMAARFASLTSEEIIQIYFLWCILSHYFGI